METYERISGSGHVPNFTIQWTQQHTLLFEEHVALDMRVSHPQGGRKVLLKQARVVYWKRWAAKHGVRDERPRSVDRQAPSGDEETGRGRRTGAEETVRH